MKDHAWRHKTQTQSIFLFMLDVRQIYSVRRVYNFVIKIIFIIFSVLNRVVELLRVSQNIYLFIFRVVSEGFLPLGLYFMFLF